MKIIPTYLVASMFITMFILYIIYPEPEVIIKHPLPDEPVSDVYIDDNDVCYRYYRNEVKI